MNRLKYLVVALLMIVPVLTGVADGQALKIGYADPEVIITYIAGIQDHPAADGQ